MPATFTPSEVSLHNHADDCWVSFFGDVYDLTTLINSYKGEALAALTMVWHGGPQGALSQNTWKICNTVQKAIESVTAEAEPVQV